MGVCINNYPNVGSQTIVVEHDSRYYIIVTSSAVASTG